MKTSDKLEAIAQYGKRLTRSDVAQLRRAALELRMLREEIDAKQMVHVSDYREGLETKIRLQYLIESMEAALLGAKPW